MSNSFDDSSDDFDDIFSEQENTEEETEFSQQPIEESAELLEEPDEEPDPALQDFVVKPDQTKTPAEPEMKKTEQPVLPQPQKVSFKEAEKYKNRGKVFNRSRTLGIMLFTFAAAIFILAFLPQCRKEEEQPNEMDKAGNTYIPDFVNKIKNTASSDAPPPVIGQSTKIEESDYSHDDVLAGIDISDEAQARKQTENIAPIYKEQATQTASSTRPETNRNPLQKTITRVAWDSGSKKTPTEDVKTSQSDNPYARFGLPPKDEYIARTAAQQAAAQQQSGSRSFASDGSGTGTGSGYTQQNNQSNKASFASDGKESLGKFQWNSAISLFKGTIISAVLETGINTDLPGPVIARVIKNVFSSLDGKYMLIPAGTRLYATYNSQISYSQKRVQIAWNTLIRPDGFEFDLGNMTGVDTQGYTGHKGFVTENLFEYVKAMGIISMFSILNGELDNSLSQLADNGYTDQLISENRQVINKLSGKLIDRALDIQPTIHIQQGTEINIITNATIELPPLESYPAQKYIRYQ